MTTIAPHHDLLVRAALSADPDAREHAYAGWRRQVDVDLLDSPELRMLPMLVDRFAADASDDPVAERLRRVVRFTWLSSQLLVSKTLPVLKSLEEAGVPVVIVKGGAVLEHTGINPGLRPMDDLDVLVPVDRVFDAAEVLSTLDLETTQSLPTPENDELLAMANGLNLKDGKGVDLDLHWHLLECSRHPRADAGFHARARPGRLRDHEIAVLSPEDTLVNVVEHGHRWSPEPALRWTSDATLLIRRCDLDWDRVATTAREHRLGVVMSEALDYLADSVQAPVPEEVRRDLRRVRPTPAQWHRRHRRPAIPEDGGPSAPGRLGRALDAWDDYAQRTLPPGRKGRPADVLRWLREMWLLDKVAAVPGHAAFVALGRPWWLRRLTGGHRRASRLNRELPSYRPGTLLEFRIDGNGAPFLTAGWGAPEAEHVWTHGGLGRLVIPIADPAPGPWRLQVSAAILLNSYRDHGEVDVVVGGRHVATWRFAFLDLIEWRTAELPAPPNGPLEILFQVRFPAFPSDLRFPGSDDRQLGLNLNRLRLGPAEPGR